MEAIVALAILVLLAALAARFGHDSRDGLRTKEYDLAASGVTWSRYEESPSQPSRAEAGQVRHPIADVASRLSVAARPIDASADTV